LALILLGGGGFELSGDTLTGTSAPLNTIGQWHFWAVPLYALESMWLPRVIKRLIRSEAKPAGHQAEQIKRLTRKKENTDKS